MIYIFKGHQTSQVFKYEVFMKVQNKMINVK